jgi:hypothetical protein
MSNPAHGCMLDHPLVEPLLISRCEVVADFAAVRESNRSQGEPEQAPDALSQGGAGGIVATVVCETPAQVGLAAGADRRDADIDEPSALKAMASRPVDTGGSSLRYQA